MATQITTPPPLAPTALHCVTRATGVVEIVVVVVQVPAFTLIWAAVPTQRLVVTVERGAAESAPVAVR
ncbi:MAG: hypothetical protein DWI58_09420 [Chloroflexi bacterium]|nr:MAG: hypothetical protein DWI58_09420 [Chloroflexota bacterium]